ncbi:MAG: sulfite exporter TauE/SafE family protein [archaeon]
MESNLGEIIENVPTTANNEGVASSSSTDRAENREAARGQEKQAESAREEPAREEPTREEPAVEETVTKRLSIGNMVCQSCEKNISRSVRKLHGVKHIKADYVSSTAEVTYDPSRVSLKQIEGKIKEAGYEVRLDKKPIFKPSEKKLFSIAIGISVLCIVILGYIFVSSTFGAMNISIPQLDANTSLALIFIVGLLTGFHCIGMCGSFVLSYTAKAKEENPDSLNISLHAKYAVGKLISYSVIGGIFGLIGSIFVFSPALRAGIAVLAGLFLILFGLKLLNIFPALRKLSLPQSWFNKLKVGPLKSNSDPMVIGLLNGLFIACGPLQAMYVLAATTGSFLAGASMLFVFALGTLIPMLGFGLFASFMSHAMKNNITKLSAIIVMIMGLMLITNGLALAGVGIDLPVADNSSGAAVSVSDGNSPGYQVIRMDVVSGGWSPNSFVLKKGVPVKWIITGKQITGCNNAIRVPEYNLEFNIKQGEQTIEFTPTKEGVVRWSCWMGMIQGTFIVKDNVTIDETGTVKTSAAVESEVKSELAAAPKPAGGCGCGGGGGTCGGGN